MTLIPRKELEKELSVFRKAAIRIFQGRAGAVSNMKWLDLLNETSLDLSKSQNSRSLRPPVRESELAGLTQLVAHMRSRVRERLHTPLQRNVFYFPVAHETIHDFELIRPGLER